MKSQHIKAIEKELVALRAEAAIKVLEASCKDDEYAWDEVAMGIETAMCALKGARDTLEVIE